MGNAWVLVNGVLFIRVVEKIHIFFPGLESHGILEDYT